MLEQIPQKYRPSHTSALVISKKSTFIYVCMHVHVDRYVYFNLFFEFINQINFPIRFFFGKCNNFNIKFFLKSVNVCEKQNPQPL